MIVGEERRNLMIRWVGLGCLLLLGGERERDEQTGRKGFCAGGGRFGWADSYAELLTRFFSTVLRFLSLCMYFLMSFSTCGSSWIQGKLFCFLRFSTKFLRAKGTIKIYLSGPYSI